MLVKESISFQRGADPKETLGIGEKHLLYRPSLIDLAQKLIKKYNQFLTDDIREIGKEPYLFEVAFNDVYLNNIYYLCYSATESFIFRWYSKPDHIGDEERYDTLEELEDRLVQVLDFDSHIKVDESMSFQRGGDPKDILGIGYERKFHVKKIMDALQVIVDKQPEKIEIKIYIQNENEFAAGFNWLENRPFDRSYWRYLLGFNKDGFYTSSYQKLPKGKERPHPRTIHDSEHIRRCISNIEAWLYI